jgi:addiction module HigA family antidote
MLPKYRAPTHPGEILEEDFLKPLSISQSKLAEHFRCKPGKINEIVRGKRGITPDMALNLSDAFGTSAEFWMNLQSNFDLWHAEQEHEAINKIAKTG